MGSNTPSLPARDRAPVAHLVSKPLSSTNKSSKSLRAFVCEEPIVIELKTIVCTCCRWRCYLRTHHRRRREVACHRMCVNRSTPRIDSATPEHRRIVLRLPSVPRRNQNGSNWWTRRCIRCSTANRSRTCSLKSPATTSLKTAVRTFWNWHVRVSCHAEAGHDLLYRRC